MKVRMDRFWIEGVLTDAYPSFEHDKGADLDGDGRIEDNEVFQDFDKDGRLGSRGDYLEYLKRNRQLLSERVPFFKWGKELSPSNWIHQFRYLGSDLHPEWVQSAYQFLTKMVGEAAESNFSCAYDVVTHHNQDLDAWQCAQEEGIIQKNAIIIHADSHSDFVKVSAYDFEGIGSYLNMAVINGTASEIYWVVPDFLKPATSEPALDPSTLDPSTLLENYFGILTVDAPREFDIYVKDGQLFFRRPDDYEEHPNEYAVVRFHKVFMDDLPDFSGEPRDVLLDVDADYFSVESATRVEHSPSHGKLLSDIDTFFDKLHEKGIVPKFAILARSPGFTTWQDIKTIEDAFVRKFTGKEYIPDFYSAYEHHHTAPGEFNFLYNIKIKLAAKEKIDEKTLLTLHNHGYGDIEQVLRKYNEGNASRNEAEDISRSIVSIIGADYVSVEMAIANEIIKRVGTWHIEQ